MNDKGKAVVDGYYRYLRNAGYQPHKPDISLAPPTHGSNVQKTEIPIIQFSLEELAKKVTDRGNDLLITHSKDGIKVFEVERKLIGNINK